MASETVDAPAASQQGEGRTRAWWRRLSDVNGFVAVAMGIIMLVWPHETLSVLSVLLGIWLIFSAACQLWQAILRPKGEAEASRAVNAVGGLLYLIAGVFCLRHPFSTLTVLTSIMGVLWLASGAVKLFVAEQNEPGWRRIPQIGVGIVSVLGGLFVLIWPKLTLVGLIRLAAIALLVQGIVQLWTTYRTREKNRAAAGVAAPGRPHPAGL